MSETTDPIDALVKLRAQIVRLAHEVDGLADLSGIARVRKFAPLVAEKLRLAAMAKDMVDASKRLNDPRASACRDP